MGNETTITEERYRAVLDEIREATADDLLVTGLNHALVIAEQSWHVRLELAELVAGRLEVSR